MENIVEMLKDWATSKRLVNNTAVAVGDYTVTHFISFWLAHTNLKKSLNGEILPQPNYGIELSWISCATIFRIHFLLLHIAALNAPCMTLFCSLTSANIKCEKFNIEMMLKFDFADSMNDVIFGNSVNFC